MSSAAAAWKTWEGHVVGGKFPLQQWLGESEGSAVFLTERTDAPGQKLTLKLVSAHSSTAGHQLKLWREAEKLSHPNLIRIYESGPCGNTLQYVAMEYAEENLSEILSQRPLTPTEVGELLPPLLDALSYLHSNGLVHGRIKPSNVLAVGDQLKLSADQVAPSAEIDSSMRRRDVYDAPERAAGVVSPAGDLWSLGVTLVAAFTQRTSTVEESAQGGPNLPDSIAEPFRSIARQCLQLDPKKRGTLGDIKDRLQPKERETAPSVPADPVAATHSSRRGPVAAALVLAVLVAAVVFFFSRKSSSPAPPPASLPASTEQPVAQSEAKPTPAAPAAAAPTPGKHGKKTSASAQVVHQVLPDVSASARRTITGTIKVGVRVEVDPSGKVKAAKLTNPGPSQYFARLSMQAAQRWEFAPAPDPSTWQLQFRFRRTSTQAVPERLAR